LAEIARCLKIDKKIDDNVELILRAIVEYTRSLHSVTDCRPAEVIHASSDEVNSAIRAKIDKASTESTLQDKTESLKLGKRSSCAIIKDSEIS